MLCHLYCILKISTFSHANTQNKYHTDNFIILYGFFKFPEYFFGVFLKLKQIEIDKKYQTSSIKKSSED
jgi:hypothetical protein